MKRSINYAICMLGLVLGACAEHEVDRAPAVAPTPASGEAPQNQRSIMAITESRCDRETRCSNIGPDKRYPSRDACLQELNDKGYDTLGTHECPGGIDQSELSQCLASIRNEDCNSPLDSLERMADCRAGELCKD